MKSRGLGDKNSQEETGVRQTIRSMMYLGFVKVADVRPTFEALKIRYATSIATYPQLNDFVNVYFEDEYMHNIEKIQEWNLFDVNDHRTNNDL